MSKLVLIMLGTLAVAGCSGKDEWPGRGGGGGGGGESLTIEWKAPAVGLVQTTHEVSGQDLTLQSGDQPAEHVRLERRIEKRTEVLEVEATFRHKVSVRYERARESQADGGKTDEHDLPVAGKSYLAWLTGGGVVATAPDGAEVGAEELAFVRDDLETELGRIPGMARLILGRRWVRGEAITLGPEQLAELATDMGPGTKVSGLTATWTGSDAGIASFDLAVDAAGDGGMQMPMKATVKIDVAHARPVEITGTAELTGTAKGGSITGAITTRVINTYVDPGP